MNLVSNVQPATDAHTELLGKLMLLDWPRRPPSWAPSAERVHYVGELIAYQRQVMDAVLECIDEAASLATDETGCRQESVDIVRGGFEDFIGAQGEGDG